MRSESEAITKFNDPAHYTKRSEAEFCITFSGLAKVAIFTTNVDAENQTLIKHKCVCGALNRQFLVGAVMPSVYSHSISILSISFINLSVSLNATMIF